MPKNKKTTWTYDGLIEAVRNSGRDQKENYVPINRSSLKEAAVSEFVKLRTNQSGKTDVLSVIGAMKTYHAANPVKAAKKIEKLKAKLALVLAEAKANGLKV